MSDKIVLHPGLVIEAKIEREVSDSPEAQALHEAIFKAVTEYSEFLKRHGLIWEDMGDDLPRLKAQALVVTMDYGDPGTSIDISLKDGALDRVYGDGVNPDPDGREADPSLLLPAAWIRA